MRWLLPLMAWAAVAGLLHPSQGLAHAGWIGAVAAIVGYGLVCAIQEGMFE